MIMWEPCPACIVGNSQGFRIGKSGGNPARTPDVAGVISLNRFLAPVDDNVTA